MHTWQWHAVPKQSVFIPACHIPTFCLGTLLAWSANALSLLWRTIGPLASMAVSLPSKGSQPAHLILTHKVYHTLVKFRGRTGVTFKFRYKTAQFRKRSVAFGFKWGANTCRPCVLSCDDIITLQAGSVDLPLWSLLQLLKTSLFWFMSILYILYFYFIWLILLSCLKLFVYFNKLRDLDH